MAKETNTTPPPSRRSFLAGLATLPLVGGSVALIGEPSAVAEPVDLVVLENYRTWLDLEQRALAWEMASWPADWPTGPNSQVERYRIIRSYHAMDCPAATYHFDRSDSLPSARAALVLSAVGCDWREAA